MAGSNEIFSAPSGMRYHSCHPSSDPEAPPLLEYIGEMAWYLDTFFDRRDGGIEVVGGVHKRVIPCNWKFPAENFDGDAYHVAWSHLSGIKVGFSPGGSLRPGAGGKMVHPANGHCLIAFAPGNLADPDVPEITAYEEGIRLEVERRLGPRFGIIFPIVSTLFPNFFFLGSTARTFRVWRPALGADPPALKNRGLKRVVT